METDLEKAKATFYASANEDTGNELWFAAEEAFGRDEISEDELRRIVATIDSTISRATCGYVPRKTVS